MSADMHPRSYISYLIALCGPFTLVIAYFAVLNPQPLVGDLTRLSGTSESKYGWNQAQEAYREPHNFLATHSLEDYDKHFDIVVAGDSFSFLSNTSWVNTLVERTGMSAIVLHVTHVPLTDLLSHSVFQNSPPKHFIFESVNRRLYDRLEVLEVPDKPLAASAKPSEIKPVPLEKLELSRQLSFQNIEDRLAQAVHLLNVRWKCFFDDSECKVAFFDMKSDAPRLFSSEADNEFALLRRAYGSRAKWDRRSPKALQQLNELVDYFDAAPDTNFMLLIYPDRLAVYADYIDAPKPKNTQLIPEIAKVMDIPRLDIAFQELVDDGVLDVFLPNDSHTGGYANNVAGQVAVDFLLKE